ncbi:MAG: fibronectin type III domain-containing protein [Pseudomonadales bacterium]|nr:hypothetical protein [Gammaproteobacteria bacterium]NNL56110.1 fibronectin type III domain-containing protein [Pseudomonadales bacterium]
MDVNNNTLLKCFIMWLATLSLCACGGGGGGSSATLPLTQPGSGTNPPITVPLVSPRQPADVQLSWTEPTTRADNSALAFAEIDGYQICYTGSDGRIILVPGDGSLIAAGQTEHTLRNLPADTYQFNVFTYDTDGTLSPPSSTVTLSANQFPFL